MQVLEIRRDDELVLQVSGRLDSNTTQSFDRALVSAIERGDTRLVLDLSQLDYIGSMGLAALLGAAKRIKAAKGDLVISGLNKRVKLVFEMSGLLRLFQVRSG